MIPERYRVVREVERGASSVVFLCEDTETSKMAVLKQISKGYYSQFDFEKEIAVNEEVASDHIVTMLGHFTTDEHYCLLFEPGDTDLLSRLQKSGPIPEPEVRTIFRNMSIALSIVHSKGVVHNDVKLENMIVMPDKQVKLTDFGLCQRINNGPVVGRKGTFRYWPPEIVAQKPHDQKADIWSLGVCIFIALTGAFPFGDGSEYDYTMRIVMGRLDLQRLDNVSADLRDLVTRMLNKDASSRPTAAEIVDFPW